MRARPDQGAPTKGRETPPSPRAARVTFSVWTWGFGGAGIVTALAGFFFLSQGSMTLAPLLLVVGFLVFFPIALTR
jgi:hypothetical protein